MGQRFEGDVVAAGKRDPTDPIRQRASRYPGVDEGTACTQSSFKAGKKAFLFVGMQGGRYKAMFKLEKSKPEAAELAKKAPDDYQVGSTAWVTARFTAEAPMPVRLWKKWLDESYALSVGAPAAKTTTKKKTASTKKAVARFAKKKTGKKKASKKKAPAAKGARKKAPARRR